MINPENNSRISEQMKINVEKCFLHSFPQNHENGKQLLHSTLYLFATKL